MTSNDIRKRFLDFFEARNHRVVRSSSLVPANDPTLLFTNAGMNQFKDVFLGREKRDYARACSSQKCVRAGGKHNDLEQVGRTTRHHTFFEMLGNFSFGDYFKAEAIPWAWELVTKDFAIPKDKLYATVFREDDEAEELWAKIVPRNRIFRRDEKDNFWQMGETGPCGPCSEIHYDMGPEASDLGHKDCQFPCPDDCGRYVEIWNLVFMQFNRDESGNMTPLPRPSIDTGAGLERLAAVLQGKLSNFDTDLFRPLIERAAELTQRGFERHVAEFSDEVARAGIRDAWTNPAADIPLPALQSWHKEGSDPTDASLRIIADHARAATFLISDGVLPSNDGRGYVLRKILRRAIRHGRILGQKRPFMNAMVYTVRDLMQEAYPELIDSADRVAKVVEAEEKQFDRVLANGFSRLEAEIHQVASEAAFEGRAKLDVGIKHFRVLGHDPTVFLAGDKAFHIYETYGLPEDFIADACRDVGIPFDQAGFDAARTQEQARARASWKGAEKKAVAPAYQKLAEKQKTVFDGYAQVKSDDCRIVALLEAGEPVSEVKPGAGVEIVLDHTPFYAESGGQVGDVGHLLAPGSSSEVAHVQDTYRPVTGVIAHKAIARETLHAGDVVTAVVDGERRDSIRRNHTATHLLHAALRSELGTHVKQAGSLVAPDRLRFDFSYYAAMGEPDLLDIEDLVNQHILANEEVRTEEMETEKAIESGAMALFGEKYGDRVRVVSIEDGSFSKELCGGTHVRRTGDIGLFKIISESSVAAGTRRIEALTGAGVLEYLRKASGTLALLGQTLRAEPDELLEAAEKLAQSEKQLRKQLEAHQMKRAASAAGDLADQAREVKGVRVVAARVDVTDLHGQEGRAAMRQMVDSLRPKLGSGVIALGSVADGKVSLIVGVTQDLTAKLDAGKIVREAAKFVEGSGGGRKDLAEAGGKNPEKLDEAMAAVPGIVEKML